VEGAAEDIAAGGYAVQQTEAYQQKQRELIHEKAVRSHVIITTAQIPGRQAPLLVEQRTVEAMLPGSVIVDLAAASGGNCAVTENGKTIRYGGITIVGDSNLPAGMAHHASKLFSNNLFNFFQYVFKNGLDNIDFTNEIPASTHVPPVPLPEKEAAKPASNA
jgi:NAD(P) transhydrogenase subunit alpha